MRIAIIGAKGLLGSSFLKYWNRIAVDSGDSEDELIALDLPEFDICSRRIIDELTEEIKPDLIINSAGINDIDWSENHPNSIYNFHCHGTSNLREAAKRSGAKLVQISCAEVFYRTTIGQEDPRESDLPLADSVFARSKRDAELAALELENSLVIRTSSLFGESGPNSSGNIAETILCIFQRTRKIYLLSDWVTMPLWTYDFLQGLNFLIRSCQTGLWHLSGRGMATPLELAEHLLIQTGLSRVKPIYELHPIKMEEYGITATHSRSLTLNTEKYHSLSNAPAMPDWRDSVNRFLNERSCFE